MVVVVAVERRLAGIWAAARVGDEMEKRMGEIGEREVELYLCVWCFKYRNHKDGL